MGGPQTSEARTVLVIGGRGFAADASVGWEDAIPNVADFDAAIAIAPVPLAERHTTQELAERLREELMRLLVSGGELYVILRAATSEWSEYEDETPWRETYDWCPVAFTVSDRTGQSVMNIAREFEWYFRGIRQWRFVVFAPRQDHGFLKRRARSEEVQYVFEPLATNRAGEALAGLLGFVVMNPRTGEATTGSGITYILPVAEPWTPEAIVNELLARRFGRAGQAQAPPWLNETWLPATPDIDLRIEELEAQSRAIQEVLEEARREWLRQRAIAGLLFESGPALESLVADALAELEVALGEPVDREEFTALGGDVLAAVEVKGWAKSATEDDYRALLSYLTEHDLKIGTGSRGILIVCAWRNLPVDERERQSRRSFPDNVIRAAEAGGRVALVRSEDLYQAVLDARAGHHVAVEDFLQRMFADSGLVRYAGPPERT